MIIHAILVIISILSSASMVYFTGWYTLWYVDLIAVAILPILHLLYFLIYLGILWFISIFMKSEPNPKTPSKVCHWLISQTAFIVNGLFRVRTKIDGELPKGRTLMVMNHRSNFDPFALLYMSKDKPVVCVTKPSNMNLPVGGKYLRYADYVPIDRDNDFEAVKAIVKASKLIKQDKASILLFPEGTRNHHPENGQLDWKAGGLKIGYKSQCPIVVLAMEGSEKINKNFKWRHTNCIIHVCEVIPYEKYKDMHSQKLADYCQGLIDAKLNERS